MSIACRSTNVVILNIKRDCFGEVMGNLKQPAEEASHELLKIAGILSNFVGRKAGLTTQQDVDKVWLGALIKIPMMQQGPKDEVQSKLMSIGPIEPKLKLIDYLTRGLRGQRSGIVDPKLFGYFRRLLEPRLATLVEDAKTRGESGISALILDVDFVGHECDPENPVIQAVVSYVTVTVTYAAPPPPEATPPKGPPALPTWGFSFERYDRNVNHVATAREPAKWRGFLAKAPCEDVTRLDTYIEIRFPDPELEKALMEEADGILKFTNVAE
jgi:hypothetical protein